MRNSAHSCTALIAAALVACQVSAFAQTVRTPAPVQRFEQPPLEIESRVPRSLESNATALAKLSLRPTDLDLGRSVTYSVTRLSDAVGELKARDVNIERGRDGHWFLTRTPGTATQISVGFRTQREKSYMVQFGIDSRISEFRVVSTIAGQPLLLRTYTLPLIDGLVTVPVTGSGAKHHVRVEVRGTEQFILHFAKVTPLIEKPEPGSPKQRRP